MRWTVIQANTDIILTRDLIVMQPQLARNLSAPCQVAFTVSQGEQDASAFGITWVSWGQVIVTEIEVDGVRQIYCCSIVTDVKVDPNTGDVAIQATGFMGYGKGIPWLADFNPIAVDPFELVQRVWMHLESFSNANLDVQPLPASSGTQMIPGYSYDGSTLSFNFYAVFIRSVDFNDCNDYITALARDIPFDIVEEATWNDDRTVVSKVLRMGYPEGGLQQDNLSFRLGVNVITATKADEMDIQAITDVIIRGWQPGKVISAELGNADYTRYRRTIMEEDAYIESDERAAAWAKRKLTRRDIPISFKEITIDPNHSDGPFGSFDVGDSIYVEAENYPWFGDIAGWHRIISIAYDETKGMMKLGLMVDGAFNYDPTEYDPTASTQPITDLNRLANGYFELNLSGWTAVRGEWIRDTEVVYQTEFDADSSSVRIDCDDSDDEFMSHRATVVPGETLTVCAVVQYENVVSANAESFILRGTTSHDGDDSVGMTIDFGSITNASGASSWNMLRTFEWVVPDGINELSLHLICSSAVSAGTAWWSYIRIFPFGLGGPV